MKNFIARWKDKGDEKSDTQKFWLDFLQTICYVENPLAIVDFEKRVELNHVSFIDVYIPATRVIIEQKSLGVSLDKPTQQSDGSFKTPFEQAKRYSDWLPDSERARWIITCNFQAFQIHDMEHPKDPPEIIQLENLVNEAQKFKFLVDVKASSPKSIREVEISVKAGELVGKLYDSLLTRYKNPDSPESLRSLNILCVRIVFLLYAEDAGLFAKSQFHDYLAKFSNSPRRALIDLFTVLNQTIDERDYYIDETLKEFPYVNGGLFEEANIEIPQLEGEPLEIILREMSEGFDWSGISPTIFGAVFESTLNPETRRKGGMHYTSLENIHKVIDPLFLDALNAELDEIMRTTSKTSRTRKLNDFQNKLGSLTFLDPACGSGNFLTETYLSLRRLENRILSERRQQVEFVQSREEISFIKVSISQFFGIEINDFAVAVARTALWIAEAQMWSETKKIIQVLENFFPLKSYNHIIEGNALTLDWGKLVPIDKLNFIMGNPPFVGRRYRSKKQHEELATFFSYRDIDYVACWYVLAAKYIQGTNIKCAFVSTNSITQGEQVGPLWQKLMNDYGIHINFAWRTFIWDSEAIEKAHVYCVIICFSQANVDNKQIFTNDGNTIKAQNINAYLIDAPNVFVDSRSKPLCDVPPMKNGNVPLDGDALKIEVEDLPSFGNFPYIKRLMGGRELLYNEQRYVLWLVNAPAKEIRKNSKVLERIELCRKNRLGMKDKGTQKLAETPYRFRDTNNPDTYIALPMVSSDTRKYIPMAYLNSDVIPTNQIQTIPNATLYHFGVLTSRIHMAWVKTIAGRLGISLRYSKDIVYNNFPWPAYSDKQRIKIESCAQKILDARKKFPGSSLADMYDPLTMPEELLKAHHENDAAVCEAYGFDKNITEEEIVAELMKMYSKLTVHSEV